MTYTYEFDPYQILGVSSEATLEEIRDAYRQKTKRHHPDVGGEEWAFRLVVRAYEILSTTRVVGRSTENGWRHVHEREWPQAGQDGWRARTAAANATMPPPPPSNHTWFWGAAGRRGEGPVEPPPAPTPPTPEPDPNDVFRNVFGHDKGKRTAPTSGASAGTGAGASSSSSASEPEAPPDPRAVFVEMLIIRFEIDTSLDLFLRTPEQRNLSCSLHVAWPVEALAASASDLPGADATLKVLATAFKAASKATHPASNQSQVEEGRFVGWLTYPTATQAADAYEVLRNQLGKHGLSVEKFVREMTIPRQWK